MKIIDIFKQPKNNLAAGNFGINLNYLSKENTDCLKGIFSIFVVICHMRSRILILNDTLLGALCTAMGYLSVSVFFFVSGYGLMSSYQKKGKRYIERFWRSRICPFYIVIIVIVAMYAVYELLIGEYFTIFDIIKSITFGNVIIKNGWYLQAALMLYIFFWIVFALFSQFKGQLRAMLLCCIGYMLLCIVLNMGTYWYESVFSFLLGIIWCAYKEKIDGKINQKRNYFIFLILSFALFSVTLIMGNTGLLKIKELILACKMISAVSFVLLVLFLIMRMNIQNIVTQKLGAISLEIYVMQGIPLTFFRGAQWYIQSDLLYVFAVTVSTLLLAMFLHPLVQTIYKRFKSN